jgi:hypothetical protein
MSRNVQVRICERPGGLLRGTRLVVLIDAYQCHDWLLTAVRTRLREEFAKLHVEINSLFIDHSSLLFTFVSGCDSLRRQCGLRPSLLAWSGPRLHRAAGRSARN